MLKLSGKAFKAASLKMLRWAIINKEKLRTFRKETEDRNAKLWKF